MASFIDQARDEIMTKHFGQDLHRILKNREDRLFGIINGIDYKAYNPANDPGLYKNYNHRKVHRRKLNKMYLQKKLKLPINVRIPMICTTSRITFQKGFELIIKIIEQLMRLDLQIVVLGEGDKNYVKALKKIAYTSLADYEKTLRGWDCKTLKSHNPDRAARRVPAEPFQVKRTWEKVLKENAVMLLMTARLLRLPFNILRKLPMS